MVRRKFQENKNHTRLTKLPRALSIKPTAIAVALVLAAPCAQAIVIVRDGALTVTDKTPPDSYELQGKSTLTLDSDAVVNNIRAGLSGGTGATVILGDGSSIAKTGLLMQGGRIDMDPAALTGKGVTIANDGSLSDLGDALKLTSGSTGTLSNATVSSTAGSSYAGVLLDNSALTLSDSTVSSVGWGVIVRDGSTLDLLRTSIATTNGTGLYINGNSNVTVSGGSISGTTQGVEVQQEGSSLTGRGVAISGSAGVGVVTAGGAKLSLSEGSSVTGATYGIAASRIPGAPTGDNTINLSDTTVTGSTRAAIVVLSLAHTEINVSGASSLIGGNGNLLEVRSGSKATLNVSGSTLTGDVVSADTGGAAVNLSQSATLTGNLKNVGSVSVVEGASWILPDSNEIGSLTLDGGHVVFAPGTPKTLTIDGDLTGSGTFAINTELGDLVGDLIDIKGTATGQHELAVRNTGKEPNAPGGKLEVVGTGGGDANFSLRGDYVDAGVYRYELRKEGDNWFLVNTADSSLEKQGVGGARFITPSAASVVALAGVPALVAYEQFDVLRTRMGEVRRLDGATGGWARSYGSSYRVASATGHSISQDQVGVVTGADHKVNSADGTLRVGASISYAHARASVLPGSGGNVNSQSLGLYATWLRENGFYLDGTLQALRFGTSARAVMSDGVGTSGSTSSYGAGMTVEAGRHIEAAGQVFIEPYVQLAGLATSASTYSLTNGMEVHNGRITSLQGKVGLSFGKTLTAANGAQVQPYARVAFINEFARGNDIKVNTTTFSNDLAGRRVELAVGVTGKLNRKLQVYGEYSYANGNRIEKPWGVTGGVRYMW